MNPRSFLVHRRSFLHQWWALLPAALVAACGDSQEPRKITQTQEAAVAPGDFKIGASSQERFGGSSMGAPHGGSRPSPSGAATEIAYDVPVGWQELPPTQFRQINLRPAGDPDADCYLTPGLSGGIRENVNRWRNQFSLPPLDEAEIAALPSQQLYGIDATLVELEGTFTGMAAPGTSAQAKAGFALVGLIASLGDQMVSIKMTGPKELLAAERQNFDAFVKSIRGAPSGGEIDPTDPHAGMQGDPHAGMQGGSSTTAATDSDAAPGPSHSLPPGGIDGAGIQFKLPSGWTKDADRPMRIATVKPAGAKQTECSISAFPGDVGGIAANIARWRGQFGLAPLSAAEHAALPRIQALGVDAVLIDWKGGTFTDTMSGQPRTVANARFLGLIAPIKGRTVFLKLTGPESEVDDTVKDQFLELCSSLKE